MALVECKFCHKKISEKAKKCPHCGMLTPSHWFDNEASGLLLLVIVVISLLLIYM